MASLDINRLKQIFSALSNEKRIRIIELCSEKEYNVTQLSKKIGLDYSVTVEYISMLGKVGLIEKRRNKDRTVNIKSLIRINDKGEINKHF